MRIATFLSLALGATSLHAASLTGTIVDATTDAPIPARVYLQSSSGEWFFPRSASPEGTAVAYRKNRLQDSVEMHTTLSAHPFTIDLAPGEYTVTVERGKEYHPLTRKVAVPAHGASVRLPLRRWINMAERNWYSGDTHVHRPIEDLPNIMLAEDLNVTFPLTYWVTRAFEAPSQGDKNTRDRYGAKLIKIDDTHAIFPRNTEYEIFTVGGKRHTLGAVFVLGHTNILDFGAPPVKRIAAARDREGAPLLDLDKHNWPWSMAIMPLLRVNLFELSNNHLWRTQFAFTNWAEPAPAHLKLNYHGTGPDVEMAWTRFGFENYYALLNCGFRINPSGGTASGVHPVPLGFGRVYVHLDKKFSYEGFRRGLKRGRSFVTTGPMLEIKINSQHPGCQWNRANSHKPFKLEFSGKATNSKPLSSIEILCNGEVIKTISPDNAPSIGGSYESEVSFRASATTSSWYAVRCWQVDEDGRFRFAHTAPWRIEFPGKPLTPRKEQINYLIRRVEEQIQRSSPLLPNSAIDEYREALRFYQRLATEAR